jgi:ribosomal protein L37AE/L43A
MDAALQFHRKLQNRYKIIDSYNYNEAALDPVGDEDEDIDNDGVPNTKSDKYLLHRRSARSRAIAHKHHKHKTEDVGPVTPAGGEYDDEKSHTKYKKGNKSPTMKKEASNPYAIGMAAAEKETGDKPPLKKSTIMKAHEIAKGIMKTEASTKMCNECDGQMTYTGDDNGWKCPTCGKTMTEEVFTPGVFELDDGAHIELTNEDTDALNFLFHSLNESNKETMSATLFENANGFENIMTFAIEAKGDGSENWKNIVKTEEEGDGSTDWKKLIKTKKEAIGDGSDNWKKLVKTEATHWDPETRQDREVSHFNIVHQKSGRVVGRASTYKRARTAMDTHDNKYGSYAHMVVPVFKQGS